MEIRKVRKRTDGIKYITIPKDSSIKAGDYVKVIKIEDDTRKGRKDRKN